VHVRSVAAFADGNVDFLEWDEEPRPDGFEVETVHSGVSAGTELTYLHRANPLYRRTWDRRRGLYVGSEQSDIFPVRCLGYMETARVTASRRPGLAPGDLVCMAYGHRTSCSAGADDFYFPLPADIDPLLGIYIPTFGPIAANALLHAAAVEQGSNADDLAGGVAGKRVVVLGAGVIGLFVTAFALRHGAAEVAVIGRNPARLESARRLGAVTFDDSEADPGAHFKDLWAWDWGDAGADIAFQTRPSGRSLSHALRVLRRQGVVIDLAFYTGGLPEVNLGEEFHVNNLAIVCAQIGRTPRGTADRWPKSRLCEATVDLLRAAGNDLRAECITTIAPFTEAPATLRRLAADASGEQTVVFSFDN
jgi:threonine dehydrogenase-like Zn-dependent dehydrogenase